MTAEISMESKPDTHKIDTEQPCADYQRKRRRYMDKKAKESELIKCAECSYKKHCPRLAEFQLNDRELRQFRLAGCEYGHRSEKANDIPAHDDG